MKNQLSVFTHGIFGTVRTVLIDEVIYFVGNDVAKVLEYARPREVISAHCKGAVSYPLPTNGGTQDIKIVPESELYRLIIKAADQSKNINIKEKAERFEKWIFEEVLPQIRQTGGYIPVESGDDAVTRSKLITMEVFK